ncbi:MAG: riboflavin synthase [Thermoguttaceae bacterium]|nr:riboflavin synthase [Thermoguttaceae bacterium]MBQ2683564.1 riboflavin synthase [Thermoguttaceae bacterium]MBQ6619088.1 riboflavin synthase [Thermoguttaceae bacterium]MBR2584921.1 riboflavin synthase [Thermoguttaceae bacterium]MBR3219349.1 riboflavin synthase [Thermoguttaceae bacterium]
MFSGIVEALGEVAAIIPEPPGCKIVVRDAAIAPQVDVADSVAVNGCCLTVIEKEGDTFAFQAGPETLARTNLGELKSGSPVNLELALKVDSRLGGHFVSGHIDGQAVLEKVDDMGDWQDYYFRVPKELARQMASKGSVAVDGVSLTLVRCEPELFSVALIPYTLKVTTLGRKKVGDRVNIETDILAKYVQRLVEAQEWE